MPVPVQAILAEYDRERPVLDPFAGRIEGLMIDLLDKRVVVSHVQSRLKDREKLREKLLRETATYQILRDITDVVGVRVITFFGDDVDRVAEIITSELLIDEANSVDKRAELAPNVFGYQSLHYVAMLDSGRASKHEWESFDRIPFEIQIRSLLQHTWAEIEHDLGYKTQEAIPRNFRRRFSRLAGLLEIGDAEFEGIRDGLRAYETAVSEAMEVAPAGLSIDQVSLTSFVQTDKLVQELDGQIAERKSARLETVPAYLGYRSGNLTLVGLRTLSEVREELERRGHIVSAFAERWMTAKQYLELRRGVSLYFLALILLAERGAPVELIGGFAGLDENDRDRVLAVYAELD